MPKKVKGDIFSGVLKELAPPGVSQSGALKELKATLEAIPNERVRKLPVTVQQAILVGRHYARVYTQDRETIVKSLNPSFFNPKAHDNMTKRTEALWEADVLLKNTKKHRAGAPELAKHAREIKARLKTKDSARNDT